jgi:excisionase family DNA binding protein
MTYFLLAWSAGWDDLIVVGDEEATPLPFRTLSGAREHAQLLQHSWPLRHYQVVRIDEPNDEWLTVDQVARLFNLSRSTFWRRVKGGWLGDVRQRYRGRARLFDREQIVKSLQEKR